MVSHFTENKSNVPHNIVYNGASLPKMYHTRLNKNLYDTLQGVMTCRHSRKQQLCEFKMKLNISTR